MKTKSNIQKVKKEISETRSLIQDFIGFSDEEWNQMFFNTAVKWAEKNTLDDESCKYLTTRDMFWGWWAIEYSRIEQELLDCFHFDDQCRRYLLVEFRGRGFKKEYSRKNMRELYINYLEYRMLECSSNKAILELSFHKALKDK